MNVRKMAGWCLILFGVINVLHAIHLNARMGLGVTTFYTFITSLLFTTGAALLWLNKKRAANS
jgi:hypothetical protein